MTRKLLVLLFSKLSIHAPVAAVLVARVVNADIVGLVQRTLDQLAAAVEEGLEVCRVQDLTRLFWCHDCVA